MKRGVVIAALVAATRVVYAGGLELPDNGTEALGRGGAFTAKADDATALEYNVAGFARQRGTRLLFDGNLSISSLDFQRDGAYPDTPSPATPWGGQPFPEVHNTGGPFFAPFVGISSDFGLDRWTFAVGVFGPSSIGNRTYPLSVGGVPSPARYDLVQALPLVVLPTLAVAVRAAEWLDIGVALHVVYGKFDLTSTSFTDVSKGLCPNPEYQPCDSVNKLHTSGATATASLGFLLRPVSWWALGANVRGPIYLNTSGTVNADPPAALPMQIAPAPATFSTNLPWVLRLGTRLIKMRDKLEVADLEFDATYENWSGAQGDGPKVNIPSLSIFNDIHPTIVHDYHDTFSLRLGAAYNIALAHDAALSLRIGGYYDSSATDGKDTRLDFDTLAKLAVTFGLGFSVHGFTLNVAYAFVHDLPRTVTDGDIRPINGAQHGQPVDDAGNPLPAVNNGVYKGETHIISLGVTFRFDELAGKKHEPRWPHDDEPTPPRPAPPPAREDEPPATDQTSAAATPTSAGPASAAAVEASSSPDLTFTPESVHHKKTKKRHEHQGRRTR